MKYIIALLIILFLGVLGYGLFNQKKDIVYINTNNTVDKVDYEKKIQEAAQKLVDEAKKRGEQLTEETEKQGQKLLDDTKRVVNTNAGLVCCKTSMPLADETLFEKTPASRCINKETTATDMSYKEIVENSYCEKPVDEIVCCKTSYPLSGEIDFERTSASKCVNKETRVTDVGYLETVSMEQCSHIIQMGTL